MLLGCSVVWLQCCLASVLLGCHVAWLEGSLSAELRVDEDGGVDDLLGEDQDVQGGGQVRLVGRLVQLGVTGSHSQSFSWSWSLSLWLGLSMSCIVSASPHLRAQRNYEIYNIK